MSAIVERYRVNWQGFLYTYRFWITAFLIACLADGWTTIYFMLELGPDAELHPGVRILSVALGPIMGPILGKLAQIAAALMVTVYLRRWAKVIFMLTTILYSWAAWYNIWGVEMYTSLLHQMLSSVLP